MKIFDNILEDDSTVNDFDDVDRKVARYLRRNVQIYIRNASDEYKSHAVKKFFSNDVIIKCHSRMTVEDIYSKIISILKADKDYTDNIEYVTTVINKLNKNLIIEDFHLLDKKTQNKLAYDIKIFWDYKCQVVVFGNSDKNNSMLYMNPDLTGRMEEVVFS